MDLFNKFLKEGYAYKIAKAEIDKNSRALNIFVKANFVVPYEALDVAGKTIMNDLPGVDSVNFAFSYTNMEQPRREVMLTFLPYLFAQFEKESSGILNAVVRDDVVISDNSITLNVPVKLHLEKLNNGISRAFEQAYLDEFGYTVSVSFEYDEELSKQAEKTAEDKAANYVPQRRYAPGAGSSAAEFDGVCLLGKVIEGSPVPVADAKEDDKGVILEGDIFDIETKSGKTKFGKDYTLLTAALYDGKNTIPVKAFYDADKWNACGDKFKEDMYLKVKGNVEYDQYARRTVLSAKSINIAKKKVKQDNADVKRVELHAHTKMSDMDALSEPDKLVSLAADWGHRAVAITDHGVVQAFPDAMKAAKKSGIKVIYGMEGYVYDDKNGTVGHKETRTNHIIILAANQQGMKNLYELVSRSHIDYFYYRPRLPKSLIAELREGLIIGSACVAGELYSAIVDGADDDRLRQIAEFYDYLEIMPLINNQFLVREDKFADITSDDDIIKMNKKVVALGDELGKPVCATCDVHYIDENDAIYRKVLKSGQHYDDADSGDGLFLRTTEEMLEEFCYLDSEKAYEIVVENTNMIADMIEDDVTPIASGKFPPKIENSEEILRNTCEKNAAKKYGSPLPDLIRKRLDRELDSIIGNGYAVMYMSAKMLVDKSNSDGYVVGSRGSVGSSFAATMSGITEVNPLNAHYICPACKHLEWGDPKEYECGIDMPPKSCPECGTMMDRDGHSIPFETFLGFEGNKEPDIDLNFAGEYQPIAHKYVEEIFGHENVFKAGTIGTVQYLTAKAFTEKYFEEHGWFPDKYDVDRIANHCVGVKRTTGQHPGGIIILPVGHSITEFCPVQRPANDASSDITTTHFDYHSIDENLLKLDILGHDAPSIIRHLEDLTGVDPMTTPMDDPKVNALFNGTDSLDIKYDDYKFRHGSYGIPEFGTFYVRQMLDDTKPEKFADLVRISGLSHGTNVWTGNAQEFIRKGLTDIQGAICTRDDIMNYLINQGLPSGHAFTIMEGVRKGKGLKPDQEEEMREHGVQPWYIESCKLISYMFPRAHAVAYVMMSYRIAYFKVHYPQAFYAAFLSTKLAGFKWDIISQGRDAVMRQIENIQRMERSEQKKKEQEMTVYEIVYEMMSRGYEFEDPTIENSPALRFDVHDGKVVVPICALDGVGESVGRVIEQERKIRPFSTIEDLQARAKVNKTAVETLRKFGVLGDMPESDQISLF